MTTVITSTNDHIEASDKEERQAAELEEQLFESPGDAGRSAGIIASFLASYHERGAQQPPAQWLGQEFARYPGLWANDEERQACANEVAAAVGDANRAKESLHAHLERGKSRESWLASKLEQAATVGGVAGVGHYARGIDAAIDKATEDMAATIHRRIPDAGGALLINRNPNLNGFIAEQHHVDTFNIDAAAKGSALRARVLAPEPGAAYQKNSMDIGIYDGNGKLVRRYQAKYCKDAEATQEAFRAGDYRGQRKLVCKEQVGQVPGSSDVIEADGVASKPLSKEEARRIQERAQIEQEVRAYDWNQVNRIRITQELGKKALAAALITVGLQGAHMLGRRAWNALMGKDNPPFSQDLKDFFGAAIGSAAQAGVQVAVAGALVVAARSGWIKLLRNTPAGQIANIAYVGLENAKVLYKFACGELSVAQTMDAMANVTCSAIGGIVGGAYGMQAGAAIGALLGPVGAIGGAFVGGLVGCMAGSTLGTTLLEGTRRFASAASSFVSQATSTLASAGRALFSLFS